VIQALYFLKVEVFQLNLKPNPVIDRLADPGLGWPLSA